jgi:hypothetical protein
MVQRAQIKPVAFSSVEVSADASGTAIAAVRFDADDPEAGASRFRDTI